MNWNLFSFVCELLGFGLAVTEFFRPSLSADFEAWTEKSKGVKNNIYHMGDKIEKRFWKYGPRTVGPLVVFGFAILILFQLEVVSLKFFFLTSALISWGMFFGWGGGARVMRWLSATMNLIIYPLNAISSKRGLTLLGLSLACLGLAFETAGFLGLY